jgi:hypothetical protein
MGRRRIDIDEARLRTSRGADEDVISAEVVRHFAAERDVVLRVRLLIEDGPARYSRTASSSNDPTNQRVVISKSRDTPILSPIALPARRRRACRLRDTRFRSR